MQIMERLYCRNLEIFVIRQPDGTRARLPAWMFEEAAQRFVIAEQATVPIVAMRGLRAEIDLLLGLLQSDSGPQESANEVSPKARRTRSFRRRAASTDSEAECRGRSAKVAASDVRTNRERDEDAGGGQ